MIDWTRLRSMVASMVRQLHRPATLGSTTAQGITTEDGDETLPARLLQHYGLATSPPVGSPAAAIFRRGSSGGALVIATASASYQVQLEEGEVALYHPSGALVLLDHEGNLTLRAAAGKLVKVGEGANQHAMRGDELLSWITTTLLPWLATHTHPGVGAPPVPCAAPPATVLSSKVEVG